MWEPGAESPQKRDRYNFTGAGAVVSKRWQKFYTGSDS